MKKTETKVNLEKDDLKRNGLKREDLEKKNKTEGNAGRGIYRYGMLALFMFCFGLGWFVYAHRESGKAVTVKGVSTVAAFEEITAQIFESQWVMNDKETYYYVDGVPVTGWQDIDGDTYYFEENGVMVKNQMVEKNRYVGADGKLVPVEEIPQYEKEGLSQLKISLRDNIEEYRGTCSVYVKNLDTNEYLCIKDEQIKSASLIKLYNMAAVYEEIENGNLEKNEMVTNYLHNMITVSDNGAFNHLLYVLGDGNGTTGAEMITDYCKENGFIDTGCGGTLSSKETGFSSIWLFTNYTSSKDCGHLLEEIYRGTLVSKEASKEMLSLLKQQEWRMKIPAGLPEGVVCANKTGEYGDRQHDAAIVYSDGADYILVVMTDGDGAAISHIQNISTIVYEYFND